MRLDIVLVLLLGAVISSDAGELPPYIKRCKADDWKCATVNANAALPGFKNGDSKFRVPSLNPLAIDKIEVDQGGLKIKIQNVKIYFTDNMEFKSIKTDVPEKTFGFTIQTPVAYILADYEMSGKLLLLPISGNGKCNFTFVDLTLVYEVASSLEDGADGQKYIKFNSGSYKTKALSKAYFDLTNLFNNDKTLAETTLKFLNENWKEVYDELGPVFLEGMAEETRNILNRVVDGVSLNDLFLQ